MKLMEREYWHRQGGDKPLFPDLLWSRPENRQHAGKLLIVGGNLHGFAAPAESFQEAAKAGVGTARVLLPDALQRTVGRTFAAGEYAPSTPSGSFGQKALAEFLSLGQWADGVLLAGDLGRNSETAILLEKFAEKHTGRLTVTKDAADYFTAAPQKVLARPDMLFVISLAQLQKMAASAGFAKAFTFGMDLLHLVETLHEFTTQFSAQIIVKHLDNIFVAANGQVSSTRLNEDQETWRVPTAAHAAVWWLQNFSKPLEALTSAVYETSK
jgi:ADP-dependent NAD(P)H-hydrate dehydratase / NAD(P)H-hydrate epimerase